MCMVPKTVYSILLYSTCIKLSQVFHDVIEVRRSKETYECLS